MTVSRTHIDLAMARVVQLAEGQVEVRIGAFVHIDSGGIRATLLACRALLGARKGSILFVVTGDPAWDSAALQVDHFVHHTQAIGAVGIVVSNKVLALTARSYFSLYPPAFPVLIDHDERTVRGWLADQ
ncbi:MAG: hypothetical protein ACO1NQ_00600 [Flavobacteriales bacterium]